MKALIDADILLYRSCHAVQGRMYLARDAEGNPASCSPRKKDLEGYEDIEFLTYIDEDGYQEAKMLFHSQLDAIIRNTQATSHVLYLTGTGNFRKDVYPEYKGHRGDKPLLYTAMFDYVSNLDDAVVINGQEADDAMGIAQEESHSTCICSIDKDLLMVPGRHYNFVKDEFTSIHPVRGLANFYKQLLTGDRVDNIPGIRGIGPKKAEAIIDPLDREQDMYQAVLAAYEGDVDTLTRNARLLWIRRKEGELWEPPSE